MTTSNAGPSMQWASGSVSSGTTGRSSANVLGHPLVRIRGIPRPRLARWWTKWMRTPPTSARKWSNAFISRSRARQSNPSAQYAMTRFRYSRSVPCSHATPGTWSGQRVARMRFRRSSRISSSTMIVKGSMGSDRLMGAHPSSGPGHADRYRGINHKRAGGGHAPDRGPQPRDGVLPRRTRGGRRIRSPLGAVVRDELQPGDRVATLLEPGGALGQAVPGGRGDQDLAALRKVLAELRGHVHLLAPRIVVVHQQDIAVPDTDRDADLLVGREGLVRRGEVALDRGGRGHGPVGPVEHREHVVGLPAEDPPALPLDARAHQPLQPLEEGQEVHDALPLDGPGEPAGVDDQHRRRPPEPPVHVAQHPLPAFGVLVVVEQEGLELLPRGHALGGGAVGIRGHRPILPDRPGVSHPRSPGSGAQPNRRAGRAAATDAVRTPKPSASPSPVAPRSRHGTGCSSHRSDTAPASTTSPGHRCCAFDTWASISANDHPTLTTPPSARGGPSTRSSRVSPRSSGASSTVTTTGPSEVAKSRDRAGPPPAARSRRSSSRATHPMASV